MLDKIDKKILTLLQVDGQISNQELAEKVALSPSPCLRRVKRLEAEGYISQYVALLDPKKLNLNLTVLLSVGLDSHETKKMQSFEQAISELSEVSECYLIAGQTADYFLKILVEDLEAYQHFLVKKLLPVPGVSTVHSSFILKNIVVKTQLPIAQ